MPPEPEAKTVTEQQAYRAMLKFLEQQYARTGCDDIAALLGSASLLDDGGTADPAMQGEWRTTIDSILASGAGREAAE